MNEDKIDRWDWDTMKYYGKLESIQKIYQDLSLERLRIRLELTNIDWDYNGRNDKHTY